MDTGASLTMASDSLLTALPNYKLRPASVDVITCVRGTTLDIVGELYLPIKIGELTSEPHRIVVVRNCSTNFPLHSWVRLPRSTSHLRGHGRTCAKL